MEKVQIPESHDVWILSISPLTQCYRVSGSESLVSFFRKLQRNLMVAPIMVHGHWVLTIFSFLVLHKLFRKL